MPYLNRVDVRFYYGWKVVKILALVASVSLILVAAVSILDHHRIVRLMLFYLLGSSVSAALLLGAMLETPRMRPTEGYQELLALWRKLTGLSIRCFPIDNHERRSVSQAAMNVLTRLAAQANTSILYRDGLKDDLKRAESDAGCGVTKLEDFPKRRKRLKELKAAITDTEKAASRDHGRFLVGWDYFTKLPPVGIGILENLQPQNPDQWREKLES